MRLRSGDDEQRPVDLRREVSELRRITITITDEAYEKAKQQADEAEMTVARWAAWLVEDYTPPQEVDPNE